MDSASRRLLLTNPQIATLMDLVLELRKRGLRVPNVDPTDGGVEAKALFLLESPGPKAVDSDFVSRDNPDPSARNMKRELEVAGFERRQTTIWNVVPFCVSDEKTNRNASALHIRQSIPDTQAFIDRMTNLQVIVFCGRKAQLAIARLRIPPEISVLRTFHPGGQSYNHKRCRTDISRTFAEACRIVNAEPVPTGIPLIATQE